MTNRATRRDFIKYATMGAAATAVLKPMTARSADNVAGANEKIRLAIIGAGSKGSHHVKVFSGIQGVEIAAICDADKTHKGGSQAKHYTDMREIFADDSIDAICTATPNHWHALTTIWALQAGKHVYVEKPVTYNLFESQMIVKAAEKYGKIVQGGFQNRSDTGLRKFYPYLHSGELGKIEMLYGQCFRNRSSIGAKRKDSLTPPASVDYNMWLGPADDIPMYRPKFHYDWHWVWNTGNGDLGNQGPHELDILMWARQDDKPPERVMSFGGRFGWNDAGETANMQLVAYDFDDYPCYFEVRDMSLNKKSRAAATNHGMRVGLYVKCENGYFRGGRGGGWVYDNDGNKVKQFKGDGGGKHQQNFIDAIRANKPEMVNSKIAAAARSSDLAHYGNMAYRVGNKVSGAELENELKKDEKALETLGLFEKHLGGWQIDTAKEMYNYSSWMKIHKRKLKFKGGDNYKKANKFFSRPYREEFVVKEKV